MREVITSQRRVALPSCSAGNYANALNIEAFSNPPQLAPGKWPTSALPSANAFEKA